MTWRREMNQTAFIHPTWRIRFRTSCCGLVLNQFSFSILGSWIVAAMDIVLVFLEYLQIEQTSFRVSGSDRVAFQGLWPRSLTIVLPFTNRFYGSPFEPPPCSNYSLYLFHPVRTWCCHSGCLLCCHGLRDTYPNRCTRLWDRTNQDIHPCVVGGMARRLPADLWPAAARLSSHSSQKCGQPRLRWHCFILCFLAEL